MDMKKHLGNKMSRRGGCSGRGSLCRFCNPTHTIIRICNLFCCQNGFGESEKFTIAKANIPYFFGIDSAKVITFLEQIPKKLYLCRVKSSGVPGFTTFDEPVTVRASFFSRTQYFFI